MDFQTCCVRFILIIIMEVVVCENELHQLLLAHALNPRMVVVTSRLNKDFLLQHVSEGSHLLIFESVEWLDGPFDLPMDYLIAPEELWKEKVLAGQLKKYTSGKMHTGIHRVLNHLHNRRGNGWRNTFLCGQVWANVIKAYHRSRKHDWNQTIKEIAYELTQNPKLVTARYLAVGKGFNELSRMLVNEYRRLQNIIETLREQLTLSFWRTTPECDVVFMEQRHEKLLAAWFLLERRQACSVAVVYSKHKGDNGTKIHMMGSSREGTRINMKQWALCHFPQCGVQGDEHIASWSYDVSDDPFYLATCT